MVYITRIARFQIQNIIFRHLRVIASTIYLLSFILLTIFLTTRFASAQQTLTIAATVNDDMISLLDLNKRLILSIQLSGLSNTIANHRRLSGQTLRSLIDEKLRLQEAKRFKITASRSEINEAEQRFARRAGLDKRKLRKLLKNFDIDSSVLHERLESEISWTKLIRLRYSPSISISDKEIDDFIATLEKNKEKPEYLISEIFLPVIDGQISSEVFDLSKRLIKKIQDGGSFAAIARNFSQSPTAAIGGSLGWNYTEQLMPEIKAAIDKLSRGEIVGPIKTSEGVYILRLDGKRVSSPFRDPVPNSPTTVTLSQAHFPLPKGAVESVVNKAHNQAKRLAAKAKNCAQFDELALQTKSPLSGRLGTFKLNQLSKQLQELSTQLAVDQASEPIKNEDSIVIIMICERTKPNTNNPKPIDWREAVRVRLINKRLNLVSEQYIRNLRRTAIVDVRL